MIDLTKPVYGIVSLDDWIQGGDGNQYKAVWGLCQMKKAEDVIGCKAGSGQANFVIVVGEKHPMVIPGCQMMAFEQDDCPPTNKSILIIEER